MSEPKISKPGARDLRDVMKAYSDLCEQDIRQLETVADGLWKLIGKLMSLGKMIYDGDAPMDNLHETNCDITDEVFRIFDAADACKDARQKEQDYLVAQICMLDRDRASERAAIH